MSIKTKLLALLIAPTIVLSAIHILELQRVISGLAENLAALALPGGQVLRGDALKLLPGLAGEGGFDLIFLDPPYDTGLLPQLIALVVQGRLLAAEGVLIAETRAGSGEAAAQSGLIQVKESRYGGTAIHYLRWSDIQGGN